MHWYTDTLIIPTEGKGMHPITNQIGDLIAGWGVKEGIAHLFIQHTSASLVASESYDPTARQDMEAFMDRIAPEGESYYRHTLEGPDDSPSHLRALLTQTSLSIPVDDGRLNLGTWQGIYLFEHRTRPHKRKVLVRCLSVED